jgi:polyisoprenoid-binding protein YceI
LRRTILFLLAAVMGVGAPATAVELQVDKTQKNLVKFTSDARFESFSGTTDKIDGYVYWPGDDLKPEKVPAESKLYFEVQLNGLDTGIGLRNRHMREEYLETDKFPLARYSGKVGGVDSSGNQVYTVKTSGTLSIHGVDRPVEISGSASPQGDHYRVQSNFEVKLTDYGIKVPSMMFLKLNEIIRIVLDFNIKEARKP